MTREDIIRMAQEAGFYDGEISRAEDAFQRFAALVAAAEREALEKIDWTVLLRQGALVTWGDAATLADRVIAAIRARGQA